MRSTSRALRASLVRSKLGRFAGVHGRLRLWLAPLFFSESRPRFNDTLGAVAARRRRRRPMYRAARELIGSYFSRGPCAAERSARRSPRTRGSRADEALLHESPHGRNGPCILIRLHRLFRPFRLVFRNTLSRRPRCDQRTRSAWRMRVRRSTSGWRLVSATSAALSDAERRHPARG